ncbi:MAG: LysM peptidoglycan-binding domain-containing protein [Chitinispirillaceae bacterium]|nr:LysM peptidoglycan-binding domain-containing protein [Chitinispirillaceae bacterium]
MSTLEDASPSGSDSVSLAAGSADAQRFAAHSDSLLVYYGDSVYYGNPDDLIQEARALCGDGAFAAADSCLKQAVKAIGLMEETDEDTRWFPASKYIDVIVSIYNETMPDSFSIPEEIMMAVFQSQMLRSVDSMKVLPSDSLSVAAMTCLKNVTYDVPMVWNRRVERALYFYLRSRSSTVDRWFTRASYYLPVMKQMFADSSLPQDLAYLPLIESGFSPLAYSYAHASGIWQFIASTGKIYGLRRTFWVDERRDPIRSTGAAISYLKKLHSDFNNWHLALAAYNCGEHCVARNIARYNTNDFWSLKRLPKQTRNYVPCYLAALTIAKNPHCFNVDMPAITPLPLDTIHLRDCISFDDLSVGLGVERDTLKKMNRHILRWCTPPDTAATILYLPEGIKTKWNDFYAYLPPEKKVRWCRHKINRGEDLQTIAAHYTISVDALKTINRITSRHLTPGHHLFVPVSETPLPQDVTYALPPEADIKSLDLPDYLFAGTVIRHRIRPGEYLGKIARRYRVSINQLCRWNRISRRTILRPGRILVVSRPQRIAEPAPKAAVATADAHATTHVVQLGDTPFSLSRKYNLTVKELAELNNLDVTHPLIKIGQTLRVSSAVPPLKEQFVSADPSAIDTASADTAEQPLAHAVPDDPPDSSAVAIGDSRETAVPGIPAPQRHDSAAGASNDEERPFYHVVKRGENLFRISLRYSVTVASLMKENHIADASLVKIGDSLRIPPLHGPAGVPLGTAESRDIVYYRVKDGDTLWRIATRFGVPLRSLYENNNLQPDSVLVPGEVIKVVKTEVQ